MSGLVAATIIAGVLLIVMGGMRLGTLIRFVPHTITTGFTAGIAVTIVLFMKMVSQETEVRDMCRERGVQLVISHPNDQPMRTMERAGFVDQVGRENFLPNIDAAIARAAVLVDEK